MNTYDGLGLDGPDIGSDTMKKKSVLLVSLMRVAAVLAAFFVPMTIGGQESPAQPGAPAYTEALPAPP
jgi:hypothetical protein